MNFDQVIASLNATQCKALGTLMGVLPENCGLHLVGGAVRDVILGNEVHDLDFAIRLRPEVLLGILTEANVTCVLTGIRRGTITAVIEGEQLEITTFRNYENENTYTQTIEEDLAARDFTINAIAFDLFNQKLVDPFDGVKDLRQNVLRTVGSAEKRYTEDPHRMLRMVRFGPGSFRDTETETFWQAAELSHSLENVASERIHDELLKILCCAWVDFAFDALRETRLLEEIIPELYRCHGVKQNHYHRYDVFDHIVQTVKNCPKDPVLRMAALLHDIGKPLCVTVDEKGVRHFLGHEEKSVELAENILDYLKFSTDDKRRILKLIANHGREYRNLSPKAVRKLMLDLGENLEDFISLKRADRLAGHAVEGEDVERDIRRLVEAIEAEKNRKEDFTVLAINGNDVMRLTGLKPGPEVGRVLRKLTEIVIENPEANTPETLGDVYMLDAIVHG